MLFVNNLHVLVFSVEGLYSHSLKREFFLSVPCNSLQILHEADLLDLVSCNICSIVVNQYLVELNNIFSDSNEIKAL